MGGLTKNPETLIVKLMHCTSEQIVLQLVRAVALSSLHSVSAACFSVLIGLISPDLSQRINEIDRC